MKRKLLKSHNILDISTFIITLINIFKQSLLAIDFIWTWDPGVQTKTTSGSDTLENPEQKMGREKKEEEKFLRGK